MITTYQRLYFFPQIMKICLLLTLFMEVMQERTKDLISENVVPMLRGATQRGQED